MSRLALPWSRAHRALVAVVVMGVLGVAAVAHAGRAPENPPDDMKLTIQGSGQVVSIDPATGRIRPLSPQDAAALSNTFQRTSSPVPVRGTLVEGGLEVLELPEEFDEIMVARIGPFGTPTFDCVDGHDAALGYIGASGNAFDPLSLPLYELTAAMSWLDATPVRAARTVTPIATEKE